MSDHNLPPDIARWPKDPFQLLGVGRGVSPRDLRRAYLHLIRTYKPEHAPEEFRRIREAYESLLAFGPTSVGADDTSTAGPPDLESAGEIPSKPRPSAVSPDAWDLAIGGDVEEAYRILSDRLESRRPSEETYLQQYWLLVTQPRLDPGREPSDVLVRGLRACGASAHRLRGLLAREAEADPAMAIGDRFQPLLTPDGSLEVLTEILGIRWRAAQRLGRREVIPDDLDALRPRVSVVAEDIWAKLLVAAASNLVWAEDKADRIRLKAISKELKTFGRNSLDLDEPLFRLDHAQEIGKGLRRFSRFNSLITPIGEFSHAYFQHFLHNDVGEIFGQAFTLLSRWGKHRPIISEIRRILAFSWDGPNPLSESLIGSHVARIAKHPWHALRTIQLVAERAPAVFAQLATVLEESDLASRLEPSDRNSPNTVVAVEDFLGRSRWWRYRKFRPHLLEFCLREMISPKVVIRATAGRPRYSSSEPLDLAEAIAADTPLLYVYRACELCRS